MVMKITTIDFETEEIKKRPDYPPKPVGVAITEQSGKSYYMSWGHPCENNCTKQDAIKVLKGFYNDSIILCHNAKFDLEVGEKFMGLPLVPKHGFECSMTLGFLNNPREQSLALKLLADKYLSMPPDEQTKLKDWILKNISGAKKAKSKWGKYICLAPAKLVGKYAKGDTIRTKKLYKLFYKYVKNNSMLEQYDYIKRALIISIAMEKKGANIDLESIEPELKRATKAQRRAENAIYKTLGDININSSQQIEEAIEEKGLLESDWIRTDKGNARTGVEFLEKVISDKKLIKNFDTYSKYKKVIGTYLKPWTESALESNRKFYFYYKPISAYTSRASGNMQQIPRNSSDSNITNFPHLRNFVIPDKGHVILNRDYSGIEVRILAELTEGQLMNAFINDPYLDGHAYSAELIYNATGIKYSRSHIKGLNFGLIYGMGGKATAEHLRLPLAETKALIKAHANAMPEIAEIKRELLLLSRRGQEFVTLGNRVYDFEDGKEFRGLNSLIQGSAADVFIRGYVQVYDALKNEDANIMNLLHDEIVLSANKKQHKKIMKIFKEAFETNTLMEVPTTSDGKRGVRWGSMTKYNDKD